MCATDTVTLNWTVFPILHTTKTAPKRLVRDTEIEPTLGYTQFGFGWDSFHATERFDHRFLFWLSSIPLNFTSLNVPFFRFIFVLMVFFLVRFDSFRIENVYIYGKCVINIITSKNSSISNEFLIWISKKDNNNNNNEMCGWSPFVRHVVSLLFACFFFLLLFLIHLLFDRTHTYQCSRNSVNLNIYAKPLLFWFGFSNRMRAFNANFVRNQKCTRSKWEKWTVRFYSDILSIDSQIIWGLNDGSAAAFQLFL